MTIYNFSAKVTVSAFTSVEADSEEEAREILDERELAQLTIQSLYPDSDEAWHIDTDGIPEEIELSGTDE